MNLLVEFIGIYRDLSKPMGMLNEDRWNEV